MSSLALRFPSQQSASLLKAAPDSREHLPSPSCLRWPLLALGLVLTAVILEFVHLRESRAFWLDQALYPARLRTVVCQMFYPLVGTQFVLLTVATLLQTFFAPLKSRFRTTQNAVLALLWVLLTAGMLTAVQNNIANVLQGRPLHWHPEDAMVCRR